jgi:hypothetical protein
LALVLVTATSATARFWAGRRMDVPWISPDETIYALLGRSLWDRGPALVDATTTGYSFVYPALIGLPLSLGDVEHGLAGAQAVGAIVMSATAVLVYLWGRTIVGSWWALAAAALTLALPELAYSGLLMSEVAVYPITTLALWAVAATLTRPSPVRQTLAGAAILLALATHVRSLALVPALFLAVALQCAFVRSREPARRQAPLLAVVAATAAVTAVGFALAGSWSDSFGAYQAAAGGYELGAAAADVVWHFAGVFLLVAGIPLVALAAMTIECVRRRERDPAACALVATASAWTICLVLEVGTFASRWVGHLVLRDLLAVVPPLFLVFALWLSRGLPRQVPVLPIAAFVIAIPAVLLPVKRFATQEAALDAFTIIPIWRFREATSIGTTELVYLAAVALLVTAAVFVPVRLRLVLPALVALSLLSFAALSTRELDRLTRAEREWVFDVGDPRWIDAAATGRVSYLQAASQLSTSLWKHAFWNRRLESVLYLPGSALVSPIEPTVVRLPSDGIFRTPGDKELSDRLIVAPTGMDLAGDPLAKAPRSTDLAGLTLWRADAPIRVSSWTTGLQPNGDILGEVAMTVFACGRGRLDLILLGKQGLPVEIRADGILYKRVTVQPGQVWQGSVATPPDADGKRRCVYTITSPGLVGSTLFTFVRE